MCGRIEELLFTLSVLKHVQILVTYIYLQLKIRSTWYILPSWHLQSEVTPQVQTGIKTGEVLDPSRYLSYTQLQIKRRNICYIVCVFMCACVMTPAFICIPKFGNKLPLNYASSLCAGWNTTETQVWQRRPVGWQGSYRNITPGWPAGMLCKIPPRVPYTIVVTIVPIQKNNLNSRHSCEFPS